LFLSFLPSPKHGPRDGKEAVDSYHNFRSHGPTRLAARLGQIPSHKKEAKETVLTAETAADEQPYSNIDFKNRKHRQSPAMITFSEHDFSSYIF
jgi:hypothetical protein